MTDNDSAFMNHHKMRVKLMCKLKNMHDECKLPEGRREIVMLMETDKSNGGLFYYQIITSKNSTWG